MDAGEVLGDHGPQAQIAGGDGGVLPARSLPVVLAADDEVAARVSNLGGASGIGLVDDVEGELRHLGDVAPEGQDARAGRHDLVGRDVVADLEQDRALDAVGQRLEVGQGRDVRALDELDVVT